MLSRATEAPEAAIDALATAIAAVESEVRFRSVRRRLVAGLGTEWPGDAEAPVSLHERLGDAARFAGANALVQRAALEQGLERVQRAAALVLADGDAWHAVTSARGDDYELVSHLPGQRPARSRTSGAALAERLGIEGNASIEFLMVEPKTLSSPALHSPSPLARLGALLRPDRADVVAVVAFAVATGVLLLATPIAVQTLVNFVALGGALPPLLVVASLLFLGLAFAGILNAVQTWVVEMLQRRLFTRVVADLGARLPRLAATVHETRYPPEIVNRFFDVITIQKTSASLLLNGLSILLSVLVGLVVLAFYHPLLLAFDLVLLIVIALIVLGPLRRGMDSALVESKAKYQVVAWLEELARSPRLFRIGGAQSWIYRRSDEATITYLEKRAKHFRVLFAQILAALALHATASTALLAIGGYLVIQGKLTLGQLVAAELIVTLIVSSVAKLGKHLESYYDLIAATEKVGQLLDLEVEGPGGSTAVARSETGIALEMRALVLQAPVEAAAPTPITLRLPAGQSLAIVQSGGPTSRRLVDVLFGLRRPYAGLVTIDGVDLRELSRESLRSAVGLAVDVEIVTGTVRQNVAVGRASVGPDLVRELLSALGVLDELQARHEGIETELTAHGRPVDTDVVNAIQLARALAGRPRLLVVSEGLLPQARDRRARVLDLLFQPARTWSLLILSNAHDVLERCDARASLAGADASLTTSA